MANRKVVLKLILMLCLFIVILPGCKSRKILTDASEHRNRNFKGDVKDRYSLLLNVSRSDIKNEKLYNFIDKWMGVPHRDAGTDKSGIDCSGFTILLQKEIYNKELPRVAKQMAEQVKRKYEDQLKEGDLVFFDFAGKKFSHVGVFLKNDKFVHVSTQKGVIISDLKDSWYYKYFSRGGSVN